MTSTVGNETDQLIGQAVTQKSGSCATRPTARSVATPEMMKDIIPDRRKLNTR